VKKKKECIVSVFFFGLQGKDINVNGLLFTTRNGGSIRVLLLVCNAYIKSPSQDIIRREPKDRRGSSAP